MKITTGCVFFEIQIGKLPLDGYGKIPLYEHSFQGKLPLYERKFTTGYIIVIKSSIRALNSINARGSANAAADGYEEN